ncbi:zinc-binding dehydrogenase [Streptosporangium soli]|nr:zinc-binding dehydrogenase [Streptosporangium sp. KLBMP 9127]
MRAARVHEFGPPEVLRVDEVPDAEPAPGELLVRVTAAGISFAEIQMRAGLIPGYTPPLPYTPGFEVAGTVVAAGRDADAGLVGSRVLGMSVAGGGYAELVALPAVRAVPAGLNDHQAVALLGQGSAAVGVIETAAIQPGEVVLVEAAAGGVGSLLVQLAKRAGARVIAVAGGERKLTVAERLGADVAIDYLLPDWGDRVREAAGGGVHVVLETVGGAVSGTAFDLLAVGGRMIVYGTAGGTPPRFEPADVLNRGLTVRGFASVLLPPEESARLLETALELAVSGELTPLIGATHPLEEAAAAHRAFEERTAIGKTVLLPAQK